MEKAPMDVELALIHWEPTPGEATNERWGQLAGGMGELRFLRDELELCLDEDNVERTMRRLQLHIVSFLHLAYWLRERAVWLVAGLCADDTLAQRFKSGRTRSAATAQVASQFPEVGNSLSKFLDALVRDTHARNIHTHESYVTLQVMIAGDLYDPLDVYDIDLASKPEQRAEFGITMIEAARKLIDEYSVKAEAIGAAASQLLESTSNILHPSKK